MAEPWPETFGPVAPLFRFETEDEAIALANDTPFGLAASAWSRDTDQSDALAVARSALRGAIVCLGELAADGSRDPAALVGPFVDALLAEAQR